MNTAPRRFVLTSVLAVSALIGGAALALEAAPSVVVSTASAQTRGLPGLARQRAVVASTHPGAALETLTDARRRAELVAEKAAQVAQETIGSPAPGPFPCPVRGATYRDDYRGPGGHPGVDMFVPTDSAAVAVVAGTVRYVPDEGAGGNTAYLAGTDGNTYFYAHFSQFVGEDRTVAQGDVIGLTGMTGNASAPHLHFEVRIGGDNGDRADPYPMLQAAAC